MCPRCPPLENLVAPTIGIEISSRDLSSAIAFHNGTTSTVATIAGSVDYQQLMRHFRDQSNGSQLHRPPDFCRLRPDTAADRSYVDVLYEVLISTWRSRLWPSKPDPDMSAQEPEDPDVLVLYENIKKLLSLEDEAYHISLPYVGLVIPEWLTATQASKLRDAIALAGKTIGTLEYSPAAVFPIYGYPLCTFSSEWMTCPESGRLMTLDFAHDALTATIVPNPHWWWTDSYMVYANNETLGLQQSTKVFPVEDEAAEAIAEWIDGFLEDRKPHKAILIGRLTAHSVFRKAVDISKIPSLLVPNPKQLDPTDVVVLGAAKFIKDRLESQEEDCVEDDECERVREEADQLAGSVAFVHAHRPRREEL